MLVGWTRGVLRHRTPILATWLILIVVGLFAAANLNQYLTTSLEVPGSQSEKANVLLATHFDENTEGTFTVIYKYSNATDAQMLGFKESLANAAKAIPTARIGAQKALIGTLYTNITTSFSLVDAAPYTNILPNLLSRDYQGPLLLVLQLLKKM